MTEPDVTITNFALVILNAIFAWRIHKTTFIEKPFQRLWMMFFASIALAAFTGGLVHGFIVDAAQNLTELENMKYHGLGTNNTAESASDTTLNTELTTAYNPDNTRATGTTTEGASANIYKTVGTNTVDGSASVVEHGIFSQAATGGGVLLDRSVFSTVSLSSGDALQSSYELTFNSGG
jgi:hypothetical protein